MQKVIHFLTLNQSYQNQEKRKKQQTHMSEVTKGSYSFYIKYFHSGLAVENPEDIEGILKQADK